MEAHSEGPSAGCAVAIATEQRLQIPGSKANYFLPTPLTLESVSERITEPLDVGTEEVQDQEVRRKSSVSYVYLSHFILTTPLIQ